MTVAAPDRPKVTAAFLKHPGGFCDNGLRLFRIVRPPSGPNGKTVLVEDCYTLKAEDMDRGELLKMRVAKWPPGLDG